MTLVYVCTNCTFYQVKGKEIRDQEEEDVREAETCNKPSEEELEVDQLECDFEEEDDEAVSAI